MYCYEVNVKTTGGNSNIFYKNNERCECAGGFVHLVGKTAIEILEQLGSTVEVLSMRRIGFAYRAPNNAKRPTKKRVLKVRSTKKQK